MIHQHEAISIIKPLFDVASLSIVVGTMSDLLPAISATLAIIWTTIRIFETDTVKKWTGRK